MVFTPAPRFLAAGAAAGAISGEATGREGVDSGSGLQISTSSPSERADKACVRRGRGREVSDRGGGMAESSGEGDYAHLEICIFNFSQKDGMYTMAFVHGALWEKSRARDLRSEHRQLNTSLPSKA